MANITVNAKALLQGCDAAIASGKLDNWDAERVNGLRKACYLASTIGDDTITLTDEEASIIVTET